MIRFLKKIFANNKQEINIEEISLSEEEIISTKKAIETLCVEVKNETNNELLAQKYEKVGIYFNKLRDLDSAIEYLELSISYKKSIGDGYKALMSLYNTKRVEAATSGNMADIDHWMNKIDEMRNIAKQAVIAQK